ncbi:MAG: hypothetical protein HY735_35750 [Verrucomicrobia bacterium]|nr:hypothetical protein [Verrucomicrobiota bacterium]
MRLLSLFALAGLIAGCAGTKKHGISRNLYRVSPELLADIARATQVRIRLKGVNAVIEKEMNQRSRDNFKKFLAKYPIR